MLFGILTSNHITSHHIAIRKNRNKATRRVETIGDHNHTLPSQECRAQQPDTPEAETGTARWELGCGLPASSLSENPAPSVIRNEPGSLKNLHYRINENRFATGFGTVFVWLECAPDVQIMRDQCTSSSRPPLLLLLLSFFYAGNRTSTQLAYGFSAAHDLARSKFWGRLVPKNF